MKKLLLICMLSGLWFQGRTQNILDIKLDSIVKLMTLQEKMEQTYNNSFMTTPDNARLNIPGFVMMDGPKGVRFDVATAFPVGIAMAATWNQSLGFKVGRAMGQEFQSYGKHQQLGPALDLCQDPRNGRSPESGGEDPFLIGLMGAQYVRGIQSTPVMATIKHYNANYHEANRTSNNYLLTYRQLMEHNGFQFRYTMQEGGPYSVMNAYNLINGEKCAEKDTLLDLILRQKWGYPFYVVSDWASIWDPKKAILAGCDLEMGSNLYQQSFPNLISSGQLDVTDIERAVKKTLKSKLLSGMVGGYYPLLSGGANTAEHQAICREAGRQSIVLLKNQNNILPIPKNTTVTVALIGPSANKAQLDGFGSSEVFPPYSVSPVQGVKGKLGATQIKYSYGCDINSTSTSGYAAAIALAKTVDYVVFIGGLDSTQEGEGYGIGGDRKSGSVQLPGKQQDLINQLASVNPNIIVVLESGGICAVPNCINNIKGFLYAFYPGQEGGNAIADVLFGDYNPGGKLPVTMPINDAQMPALDFDFRNDFNCGYRWYNEKNITPQYAFGYGLSYTTFTYSNISLSNTSPTKGEPVTVTFDIQNTGSVKGDEVVQLYVSNLAAPVWMPKKELKGFERITLEPGQKKTVTLTLTAEHFYYFDESTQQYVVAAGNYVARVGGASDNLPLTSNFTIGAATSKPDLKITRVYSYPRYPRQGEPTLFLALVKNQGTGNITAGTTAKLSFTIDGTEATWGTYLPDAIPAGGASLVCVTTGKNGSAYWNPTTAGIHSIIATIDVNGVLSELIETNNTFKDSITVYDSTKYINLALKKPITATSSENGGLDATKANDGSTLTRWGSAFADPQVLLVDLQADYTLNQIKIFWEDAYAKEYTLEVSLDNKTWTTITHIYIGDGGWDVFDTNTNARYIRMTGLKRNTVYGYSIKEIEAYGKPMIATGSLDKTDRISGIIYPNPVHGKTKVFISEATDTDVLIYDTAGKLVLTSYSGADHLTDIGAIGNTPGLYIVQFTSQGQTVNARLVVE